MRLFKREIDKRTAAAGAFAALASVLALYIAANSLLPVWVERRLNSMLGDLSGSSDVHCEVLRFDAFGAELGQFRVGPKGSPALLFESCNLRYSPLSLMSRRIDKLTLSGLDLNCQLREGKLSIPGFKSSKGAGNAGSEEAPYLALLRQLAALPVSFELIEVKNAQLSIDGDKFTLLCPFECNVIPEDAAWSAAQISLQLQPNGQRISVETRISRKDKRLVARAASLKEIRLESLPITAFMPQGAEVSGRLEFEAHATFEGAAAQLSEFKLDASAKPLAMDCSPLAIDPGPEPLLLKVRHASSGGTVELKNVNMAAEYPFEADRLFVKYALKGKAVEAEAELDVKSHGYGSIISAPCSFAANAQATPTENGWRINGSAKAAGKEPKLDASWYGVSIESLNPSLDFEASLEKEKPLQFNCAARLPNLKLASAAFEASIQELSAMARRDEKGRISADAVVSKAALSAGSVSAKLPSAALNAELKDGICAGSVSVEEASAGEAKTRLSAEELSLRLPFRLPFVSEACDPGFVKAAGIKLQDRKLGRLDARIYQAWKGLCLDGAFDSDSIPGLKILVKSENKILPSGLESSSSISAPAFKIQEPFDLGKLSPKAKGMSLSGEFALDGDFHLDSKGRRGKLLFKASNAAFKTKDLAVEGIDASFEMPHLPIPISAPGQKISFKQAKAGALALSDGKAVLRMDAADELFLERFSANWCGGKLWVQSFPIKLGAGKYDLLLHCDRVSMGGLLEQFGVEQANGEGSLNGTIPLSIDEKGISFQDGFLYSTPGSPATLRIPQTDFLMAGVSEDSPAYGNLFIAKESLKNFTYSWAKLRLDTKDEILRIQLAVDGKPANVIPVDSKPDGSYVVNPKGPGTAFPGITLEVNFNVPLSKVLGIGKGLKGLMGRAGN